MTYESLRHLLNVAKAQMHQRAADVISAEDDEAGISRDTLIACQSVLSDLQSLLEAGHSFGRIDRALGGDLFHAQLSAVQGGEIADRCYGPRAHVELPSFL